MEQKPRSRAALQISELVIHLHTVRDTAAGFMQKIDAVMDMADELTADIDRLRADNRRLREEVIAKQMPSVMAGFGTDRDLDIQSQFYLWQSKPFTWKCRAPFAQEIPDATWRAWRVIAYRGFLKHVRGVFEGTFPAHRPE